jgi:DNA-binding GntR family transcriptional regulator
MTPVFQTARQYVVSVLRTEILDGTYPEGARLRQEEVAKRLNVSTTPVREAFRDLLAEGLVWIDAHKGVVSRGLTATALHEIYELRILLEPMLAARACAHASAETLRAAAQYHRTMQETADPDAWSILNESFHGQLVASQSQTRLHELTASLATAARPYVVLSMHVRPELIAANNQDHDGILAAFEAGDATLVEIRSRQHLKNTLQAVAACVAASPPLELVPLGGK